MAVPHKYGILFSTEKEVFPGPDICICKGHDISLFTRTYDGYGETFSADAFVCCFSCTVEDVNNATDGNFARCPMFQSCQFVFVIRQLYLLKANL